MKIRYCACGCGEMAKRCYSGDKFKSWRAYASGHAPNSKIEIRIPSDPTLIAYAAGIIDGEGCIYARVRMAKRGFISTYLSLSVKMCSESVVAWLARHFGGEVVISQMRGRYRRTIFGWQVRGAKVSTILKAVIPFLIEKQKRAGLAIELSELLANSKVGARRPIPQDEMKRRVELSGFIKQFNQNPRSEDVVN